VGDEADGEEFLPPPNLLSRPTPDSLRSFGRREEEKKKRKKL